MCSATRGLRLYAWASNIIRKLVIAVLRHGPVPQHIAFIMDGNRRFATKQGLKRMHGHQQGYLKASCRLFLGQSACSCIALSFKSHLAATALGCSAMEPGLRRKGNHSICIQHRQLLPRHRRGRSSHDTCRAEAVGTDGGQLAIAHNSSHCNAVCWCCTGTQACQQPGVVIPPRLV